MKAKHHYSFAMAVALISSLLNLGYDRFSNAELPPSRIIFIHIDSMHPDYINLNSEATGPGEQGDWLMPRVRKFVKQSAAHWPNAKSLFPQSTDSNTLNILASTNSGKTGILGVRKQPEYWGLLGLYRRWIHLSKARYPNGSQVKTIFDIVKEQVPNATIAFISNKGWVPEEYGAGFCGPAPVDIIVNGENYPAYIDAPVYINFYDNPETDPDAYCDPESEYQTTLFRLFQNRPERHPRDAWIAEAALRVTLHENPDMLYILLGDLDHGQHLLGAVNGPSEWQMGPEPSIPVECENKFRYRWVSRRNEKLFKEPILDLIRDVDLAFGTLVDGLEEHGYLHDAVIILVSDHNMENYLYRVDTKQNTDINIKLEDAGLAPKRHFTMYNGASAGFLYWRPLYKLFHPSIVMDAKQELENERHMAYNHATGVWELPWFVIDRQDMIDGKPELGIDAMEVYNDYFVQNGVWPDLVVVMKEGWQIRDHSVYINGEEYPILNAGHGSPNTAAAMLAIKGLGFPAGVSCAQEAKLSGVAVTLSDYMAWPFPEAKGTPLVCQPQ